MAKEKMKRNLTLTDGIFYVISLCIGTGIFLKPSVVLANTGSSGLAITIWIVGGLISLCCALTIAEIATYIPKVGGLYAYLVDLYGSLYGFLYGWIEVIVSSPGGTAALAIACASFASYFIPMDAMQLKIFAGSMIILLMLIQIVSTKLSMRIQAVATIGKLVPIVAIIIFGLMNFKVHNFNYDLISNKEVYHPAIGVALLGVLWSYDGWLNTCGLGDEMIKPEKNLPRSIIFGLLPVIIIFTLFNVAIFNVMGVEEVATSQNIGVDVSIKLFGAIGTTILTIGMFLSSFAALNAQLTSGIRVAYAMADDKQIPKHQVLSKLSPRFKTPLNAILFQAIISLIFVSFGNFESITNLCIFVIWIFFTLGVFGIFKLHKKYPIKEALYRVPLYPLVPILGGLGGLFILGSTIWSSFMASLLGIGLTMTGLPVYYFFARKNQA